jgi:hypothetical protein
VKVDPLPRSVSECLKRRRQGGRLRAFDQRVVRFHAEQPYVSPGDISNDLNCCSVEGGSARLRGGENLVTQARRWLRARHDATHSCMATTHHCSHWAEYTGQPSAAHGTCSSSALRPRFFHGLRARRRCSSNGQRNGAERGAQGRRALHGTHCRPHRLLNPLRNLHKKAVFKFRPAS